MKSPKKLIFLKKRDHLRKALINFSKTELLTDLENDTLKDTYNELFLEIFTFIQFTKEDYTTPKEVSFMIQGIELALIAIQFYRLPQFRTAYVEYFDEIFLLLDETVFEIR